MPVYAFRCLECGSPFDEWLTAGSSPPASPCCGIPARRIFSFAVHNTEVGDAYLSPATGTVVNNNAQFRSDLSRLSDEHSERTGMAHDYRPVDLRDRDALGVTEHGLEATRKQRHDKGLPV